MSGSIVGRILEFLFPTRANCLGCGDDRGCDEPFLCAECRRRMYASGIYVQDDGWAKRGLDVALFPYYYERPVKGLIRALKFRSVKMLAPYLASGMAPLLAQKSLPAFDCIVPVPLHSERLFERGFNQSELLARALSEQTGIPTRTDYLARIRRTRQQSKLKPRERGGDLRSAFRASGDLSGQRILLVDDVITTGSTACACASALKEAGALEVYAIAVAGSHRLYRSSKRLRYRRKDGKFRKSNPAVKI